PAAHTFYSFFLSRRSYHRALHSFPTRRSSDLRRRITLTMPWKRSYSILHEEPASTDSQVFRFVRIALFGLCCLPPVNNWKHLPAAHRYSGVKMRRMQRTTISAI